MFVATKDGRTVKLTNDVQLAAFLNSGWTRTVDPIPSSGGDDNNPDPPRTEIDREALHVRAKELGLRNAHSMSDDTLLKKVAEAEKGAEG